MPPPPSKGKAPQALPPPGKRDARPAKAAGDPPATPAAKRSQQAGGPSTPTGAVEEDAPSSPARDFAREERTLLEDAAMRSEARSRGRGRGAPRRRPDFDRGGKGRRN